VRRIHIHPLTPIRVKNNVFNIDKHEKCENNNRKFLLTAAASAKTRETTTETKLHLPKNVTAKSNHNYRSPPILSAHIYLQFYLVEGELNQLP